MLLLLLGAILYVKGNIHWFYYKDNLDDPDIDFLQYMDSISSLQESTIRVITFYGPFFISSLFEKQNDKNKKRKRWIYMCLALWWIILIFKVANWMNLY